MTKIEDSPEVKKEKLSSIEHLSTNELETLAEKRHFNEHFHDDPSRVEKDHKVEAHIREEMEHLTHEHAPVAKVEKGAERSPEEKLKRIKKIATNITDFIPVVGSIKMMLEGARGKQYGTDKEIKGYGRLLHTVSGLVFLVLDITGVGAIASELGKGVIKLGERAVIKSAEEKLALEAIQRESEKLTMRGEDRVAKKEKIANG